MMVTAKLTFPEIFAQMTLTNVVCKESSVRRESNGPAESARLNFSTGFGAQEDQVVVEISQDVDAFGLDGEPFLNFRGGFLVTYTLPNADNLLKDDEELASIITRYAHMAVHPYLRALTSDQANQVGVPLVTLGFLRKEAALPETITIGEKIFSFDLPTPIEMIEP